MVMVAQARPSERAEFIKRTYTHLAGAVGAFVVVEFLFFQLGIAEFLASVFVNGGRFGWLALLGGFALLGYLASNMASKADDVNAQYTGLGLYVIGEAVIEVELASRWSVGEHVVEETAELRDARLRAAREELSANAHEPEKSAGELEDLKKFGYGD